MPSNNAAMARRALYILCEHFGYIPSYEETTLLYMDLCDLVHAHRKEGGEHTVESLLLSIMANEVAKGRRSLYPRATEEGEG